MSGDVQAMPRPLAADYAETIAAEVRAVEQLLRTDYDVVGDDDDRAEYYALVNQAGVDVDVLAERDGDVFHVYLDGMLDVDIYRKLRDRAGDDVAWIVRLLRTCGGPHCHVEADSASGEVVEVRVWWGSERATVEVFAPQFCARLDDLAVLQ